MGEGPVTDTNKNGPASWRLQPPVDALTQGVVVSGFSKLPFGKALFLKFDWPPDTAGNATGRGSWLTTLQKIAIKLHLDRLCEVGPCARCAQELFVTVSRGHVPRRPAPPAWR